MVARLVTVKNHLGVLQALAQLNANGIQLQLALAGEGPLRVNCDEPLVICICRNVCGFSAISIALTSS